MANGYFVLSLDYEMLWGAIFNRSVEQGYRYRVPYVKKIICELLKLFEKYNIHATWATVGAIACTKEEAVKLAGEDIKDPYGSTSLKEFITGISAEDAECYFSPDTILDICKINGQEIASHTFSHFYFKEHDEAYKKLIQELESSKKVLESISNSKIKSLVMPKNQVTDDITSAMCKTNFSVFRGVQISERFNKRNKWFSIMRFIDAYFPVCGKSTYPLKSIKEGSCYNIRASAFWRTYFKKLFMLEPLKIFRVKSQIKYAALHDEVFHLWFHPHNLSGDYLLNLKKLEKILIYFDKMRNKYGMRSCNMGECASLYEENDNG